jgi:Xaa-Pro aminopeptidase
MIRKRLDALRRLMKEKKIEVYLVPDTDAHRSEYVPACWQRRSWISGFTGSAGSVVVGLTHAGLWTDARYFLQAEQELKGSGITLFREGVAGTPDWIGWIKTELHKGGRIGADPGLLTAGETEKLTKELVVSGIQMEWIEENLIDSLWQDRPKLPQRPVRPHPVKYAGEDVPEKLAKVRQAMEDQGVQVHVLSKLDSIAWLFNIRGDDVPFNPVAVGYALITPEKAYLFAGGKIFAEKLEPSLSAHWGNHVHIYPYFEFEKHLIHYGRSGSKIWLDPESSSRRVSSLAEDGGKVLYRESPVPRLKAVKNAVEIKGAVQAHIRDGTAMVRFLAWLQTAVRHDGATEMSASDKLEAFRSEQKLFQGPSFATVAGYKAHGAIIHYKSSPATDCKLKEEGLFLIDSGGQYLDGTTDITRTVSLGSPGEEEMDRFTLVLKGLIALSGIAFPTGTRGVQLDTPARLPLWNRGLDYGHGTGHGVGSYLNVHEGPQAISPTKGLDVPLEERMVISLEPGFYEEGKYGIRTENLAYVVKDRSRGENFLRFETLTLCPIDLNLVKKELLAAEEIDFLNRYHRRVWDTLSPLLSGDDRTCLQHSTRSI